MSYRPLPAGSAPGLSAVYVSLISILAAGSRLRGLALRPEYWIRPEG
jgi:hypothetical protein